MNLDRLMEQISSNLILQAHLLKSAQVQNLTPGNAGATLGSTTQQDEGGSMMSQLGATFIAPKLGPLGNVAGQLYNMYQNDTTQIGNAVKSIASPFSLSQARTSTNDNLPGNF
jgi:hypothetical protein